MSATKDMEIVSLFDPAIDRGASAAAEYTLYRNPEKLPAITRPGMAPAVFTIGKLTRDQWKYAARQAHDVDRFEAAFAQGVRRVTGLEGQGGTWTPASPGSMTPAELEIFEFLTVEDIGKAVITLSQTPKGSKPLYLRSRSCLSAWGAMESEHPSVEPSPAKPPPSSANP